MLGATAPLRAGQVGDEPQFRVRIETSNLDALRESLERAGYDVLGTDPTSSTIEVAVSRFELYGLHSRGLSVVSVERGHPLQTTPAKQGDARQGRNWRRPPRPSRPATSISTASTPGSARSPTRTPRSRRSST